MPAASRERLPQRLPQSLPSLSRSLKCAGVEFTVMLNFDPATGQVRGVFATAGKPGSLMDRLGEGAGEAEAI